MVLDIVVIKVGVTGLIAARRLTTEGFSVTVLDPNQTHTTTTTGHGIATCAHASTVANMASAYGDKMTREHMHHNLTGLKEIRGVTAAGALELTEVELHGHSLGVVLDRELGQALKLIGDDGAEISLLPAEASVRAVTGLRSPTLLVGPTGYAAVLGEQAKAAEAKILHDVTITRIKRLDGATQVMFWRNLTWSRDLEVLAARAIVSTLAMSPWGSVADVGQPQYVPILQLRGIEVPGEITLLVGPLTWLIRPIGEEMLLLGPKYTCVQVAEAAAALVNWVTTEFGTRDVMPGQLIIDPSDHGRPVVGASAIPDGFYTRGNGRGELMNGAASDCYLAALLLGVDVTRSVLLPWASKVRAGVGRLLHRR